MKMKIHLHLIKAPGWLRKFWQQNLQMVYPKKGGRCVWKPWVMSCQLCQMERTQAVKSHGWWLSLCKVPSSSLHSRANPEPSQVRWPLHLLSISCLETTRHRLRTSKSGASRGQAGSATRNAEFGALEVPGDTWHASSRVAGKRRTDNRCWWHISRFLCLKQL